MHKVNSKCESFAILLGEALIKLIIVRQTLLLVCTLGS